MRRFLTIILCVLGTLTLVAGEEGEEKEKKKKKNWSNNTELSTVSTAGNSEANSFGLINKYAYVLGKGTFTWNVFAIEVETTTTTTVTATGTEEAPVFIEDKNSMVSSENYRSVLEYKRDFAKRTSWFAGLYWEQDEPQGFSDRSKVAGGVANTWFKSDKRLFSTNYGIGFNEESLTTGLEEEFVTAELGYVLMLQFGNAQFDQKMESSISKEDSDDWRVRLENGLTISILENLALKLSVILKYNNQPNVIQVPLADTDIMVGYELENLDTQITTSLVIRF